MSDFATAFRLDGKTALVTGAAKSIGAEICAAFAQAGARVRATDMGAGFIQHLLDLKLVPDYARAEAVIKAAHPMGLGEPRDVASAVLYLASDASRWSTGSELVLDGGYTAA